MTGGRGWGAWKRVGKAPRTRYHPCSISVVENPDREAPSSWLSSSADGLRDQLAGSRPTVLRARGPRRKPLVARRGEGGRITKLGDPIPQDGLHARVSEAVCGAP